MSETPVVELIRVSTEGQAGAERQGIPAQRRVNRETCVRFHLSVVESVEIIESGTTVATSAEMARVLEMVTSGRAKGIVLAAYDRLFRPDRWTDLAILQTISESGAHIFVPAGPIDLQTELGFVQASVNNMLAGLERRRIRERTLRAKDEMRRAGKLASGKPPFGMSYDKAAGWAYTDQVETVKAIYRAFLSGRERCFEALAERFALKVTQVRAILRRPVYAGWLIYPSRGESWKRDLYGWPPIFPEAPDGAIRVETGLPPAVPVEDFLEAQRIIEHRSERKSMTRASRTNDFLYRGMIDCGCGAPVYGIVKRYRNGSPSYFYGCRSLKKVAGQCGAQHMVRHRVEAGLDRVVSERLTDPDLITAAVEAFNDSLLSAWRDSVPDAAATKRRRAELARRRARVAEAFLGGLVDRATADREVAGIDAQLGAMPAQAAKRPPTLRTADALQVVRAFRRWPRMSWTVRREIIEALSPTFVLNRYLIEGVHMGVHGSGGSRIATAEAMRLWIPLGWAA